MIRIGALIRQLQAASDEDRTAWRKDLMACGDIVLPPKLYDALRPWPNSGPSVPFNVKPASVSLGYYHNHAEPCGELGCTGAASVAEIFANANAMLPSKRS